MRRLQLFVVLVLALSASSALAADVGVGVTGNVVVALLKAIPPEAIIAVLGLVAVSVITPLVFKRFSRPQQDQILNATRGVYNIVSVIAAHTDMKLDDAVAEVIKRVADEMGRELKPVEVKRVANIALAMHADPAKPQLVPTTEWRAEMVNHLNLPSPVKGPPA